METQAVGAFPSPPAALSTRRHTKTISQVWKEILDENQQAQENTLEIQPALLSLNMNTLSPLVKNI